MILQVDAAPVQAAGVPPAAAQAVGDASEEETEVSRYTANHTIIYFIVSTCASFPVVCTIKSKCSVKLDTHYIFSIRARISLLLLVNMTLTVVSFFGPSMFGKCSIRCHQFVHKC